MNDTTLELLHQHEFAILLEVKKICERHNLVFYLAEGSLLGAVRHQGFIPWDDDLDIAMPRKDYNLFRKIVKKELPDKYYFQDSYDDKNYYRIAGKIREHNTLFLEDNLSQDMTRLGIYIDIFPLDSGRRYSNSIRLKQKLGYLLHTVISAKRSGVHTSNKIRLLGYLPDPILLGLRDLMFYGRGNCYISYGSYYGIKKHTIEKKYYDNPIYIDFNKIAMPVPADSHYILSRIYGNDYMVLPPVENRKTHNPLAISFDLKKDYRL